MKHAFARRSPDAFAALSSVPCSIAVTDATKPGQPIVYVNAAFSALTGYTETEVFGQNCRFLQGVDTDPQIVSELREAVAAGIGIRREILNYRKDGTPFWNDLQINPIHDASGLLTGFVSMQYEATAAHAAKAALTDAEARLDSIATHISGYIYRWVLRTNGAIEIVYHSPSLRKLLEVGEADVLGKFYDFMHPDDGDALIAAIRASAATMSIFREEFRLISASGNAHWVRSEAPPRRMANGEIVWDGIAIEISAEKRWEGEIANLAFRDPLTDLLNRTGWRRALKVQLDAENAANMPCGVLYIDIEAFHDLNDRLGQAGGDEVLRETAQRISVLAASLSGVAARLGGDEFGILVPLGAGDDPVSLFAKRTGDALALPMLISGQDIAVRTCIGAALSQARDADLPLGEIGVGELMAQGELALRWAKQAGRGSHVLYSREQDDRFHNQAILAQSLEHAIVNDELELHYQPLVDLASGRIISAEALVRWNHPTLGMQRPDLFIPLAEQSGLIVALGGWVFKEAVRQRMLWRAAGLQPPRISINVSGKQLIEPGFVESVKETLKLLNAQAADFEIELTEGELIEPSPHILESLHALRDAGFTIAIDDFGSGHATFRYLRDFPIDRIKIDQMFVRKLVLESTDAIIIRAIVSLARGMGVALVAEGIETEMQRDFLQREGCEIGQGYLFSMPLMGEDFAWMLANDVRLPLSASAQTITDQDRAASSIGANLP